MQFASPLSFTTAVAFVASVVAAYVLSSINDFLREFLEGKHIWPPALGSAMRSRQHQILLACDEAYEAASDIAIRLDERQQQQWHELLTKSAGHGLKAREEAEKSSSKNGRKNKRPVYDRKTDPGAKIVASFRDTMNRNLPFSYSDVQRAVRAMASTLRRFDVTTDKNLEADHFEFLTLIGYARSAAMDRELRAFTMRQTRFGTVAEPTMMGNIASAIASYTTTRYGIDLDTFWSRIISVLQKVDDKMYRGLLDAKTQLDFLVSCCFLAALTWIVWVIALALFGTSLNIFLVVAVSGPIVVWLFYSLTMTNYLSYGEIVRASVDLSRFALLQSLHVRQPGSIREERDIWRALRELSSFGSEGIELSYEPDKASSLNERSSQA